MELLERYQRRQRDPVPQVRRSVRTAYKTRPHVYTHLYGTKSWRNMRNAVLGKKPLCASCGTLATDVDHIHPHRGDSRLFHDPKNLQPLCNPCHRAKTKAER